VQTAVWSSSCDALKAAVSAAETASSDWEAMCQVLQVECKQLQQQRQQQTTEIEQLKAECAGLKAELRIIKQQPGSPHSTVLQPALSSGAGSAARAMLASNGNATSPLACTPLPWGRNGSNTFETCNAPSGAVAKTATPSKQQQQQQSAQATPMPVTPGAGSPATSAAQQQQQQQQQLISIGSDANNVVTPMDLEIAQQRLCGSKSAAAAEVVITTAAVKEYLEEQPTGATAANVLRAFCAQFGCASDGTTVEKQVAGALATCLQQLVDDVEVFRKGKASAITAQVDMSDSETLYIALC